MVEKDSPREDPIPGRVLDEEKDNYIGGKSPDRTYPEDGDSDESTRKLDSLHENILCVCVCMRLRVEHTFKKKSKRSPKNASFRLTGDTQHDVIPCLVVLIIIIFKIIYIIIYIYAQHTVMPSYPDGMPSSHVSPMHDMTAFYAPQGGF